MSERSVIDELQALRREVEELRGVSRAGREMLQQLRQEASLFRHVVQASPVFFLALDARGFVRVANDALLAALGVERESFVGRDFLEILRRSADHRDLYPEMDFSVSNQTAGVRVHRLVDHQGRVLMVEWHGMPVRSDKGLYEYYFAIRIDVTERERTMLALEESQRRLHTLLSNLPGMAYRCANDDRWTMEFVSQGAELLTGWSSAALIGNAQASFADLILPEERERVWEEVQGALNRREPFRITYQIRCAQGEIKRVWEQGQGVFDPCGQLLALEGFITDITGLRDLEERGSGS